MKTAPRVLTIIFLVVGVALLVSAIGFYFQMDWATSTWPLPAGRLSYIFLAAILVAVAAPMLWVGLSGEWGAAAGGAVFPLITAAGMGVFALQEGLAPIFIAALVIAAVYSVGIVLWGWRIPLRDMRPMPRLLRLSFIVFALVLIMAGGALVFKMPNIMPWPVTPESSVMFGWVFLGAASSYVYGTLYPRWHYARAPLLGFLVYDLVLLLPLVNHFGDVKPENQLSLILYTAVVVYSALLAIYYLFIERDTRSWAIVNH